MTFPPQSFSVDRRRLLAGGLALLPALAGCGVLPTPAPPPQLYTLSPKGRIDGGLPSVGWQLGIDRPTAAAAFDTARIAFVREALTIDYYAGVQWIDIVPAMLQRLLVESFENSGKIVAVGRSAIGVRSDYALQTEIREFQAEHAGAGETAPRVRVRLACRLVQMPQRAIIAIDSFDHVQPAADSRMLNVVRAFDAALGRAIDDVVRWTLTTPPRS